MKTKRLTEKTNSTPIYDCDYVSKVEEKGLLDKLGQLEDLEEELGIDLVTLLRVQTAGAYFKGKDRKWIPMTDYNEKCFKLMETELYRFYFKDYGKTWALTKEELE